jgi:hypothetical protein
MSSEVVAIILGPIIAVAITLWWQNRKEKRDAKLRLFISLMAQRKTTPPTYEWVQALNLIDVVFAKDRRVVELWHELFQLFENRERTQTQDHKYIELLSEMASVLGFRKLQQTDIDKFYYPQSYVDALLAQNKAQAEWLRVLENTERFSAVPRAQAPDIPFEQH